LLYLDLKYSKLNTLTKNIKIEICF